jgi:hypothetical protein
MAKQSKFMKHAELVNQTRSRLMLPGKESISPVGATDLTGTQQATKKALGRMETLDEVLGTVLSDKKTKFCLLDIETGMSDDAKDFMPDFDLLKPEIKEPKYKKDGELYANSKSIVEQESDWLTKRKEIEENWIAQCPLSPMTAKVIAVSYMLPTQDAVQYVTIKDINVDEKERTLIYLAWEIYKHAQDNNCMLVGHNIKKFDLPMLVRRSWKHGIKPLYDGMIPPWESKWIVDTMVLWNQGNYGEKFISLDDFGQFLGFGKKTGKGRDFAKMLETDYKAAIEYVTSEMKLLKNIANKLL